MYTKYRDPLTGTVQVRDVRHFRIRPLDCEEEDGSTTHGAVICDGFVERAAFFGGALAGEIAGLLLDGDEKVHRRRTRKTDKVVTVDDVFTGMPECEELAWFRSWEIAEKVMDKLCQVLANGRQFFDLTIYGEDGEVDSDGWYR